MTQKTKNWHNQGLVLGLWVALIPCHMTWAAPSGIPTKDYRPRLTDCHRLGAELILNIPLARLPFTRIEEKIDWGGGCFYGYAWVQEGALWYIPEIGLKYEKKRRKYKDLVRTGYIQERCLYIPVSVSMLLITPAHEADKSWLSKITCGVGYEIFVALSSQYIQKGKAAANLFEAIPELSRFSGSGFAFMRCTTYQHVYMHFQFNFLPASLLSIFRSKQNPNAKQKIHVTENDMLDLRYSSELSTKISLGVDIMQMLED